MQILMYISVGARPLVYRHALVVHSELEHMLSDWRMFLLLLFKPMNAVDDSVFYRS